MWGKCEFMDLDLEGEFEITQSIMHVSTPNGCMSLDAVCRLFAIVPSFDVAC